MRMESLTKKTNTIPPQSWLPLSIIKTLIGNSTKQGDIVLDCFMGSGTTAVSCQETGRQFVGFEIEEKWCKIANERLEKCDANGQTSLFYR